MTKPKLIESPEQMWQLFEDYRKETKASPRYKYELAQKLGEPIAIPLERPLTMEGFENYCADHVCLVHQYFANQEGRYGDYVSICSRIRKVVREDQITGGLTGQYNHSITQRLNGLVEKTENDHHHEGTVEITLNLNK